MLDQLQPTYAWAAEVEPDDPAISAERISYMSPDGHGKINALLAKPAGASGKLPAVLVIHENRGLNPYIEDVARRVAKAGYLALAPDGLSPLGGYPGNDEDGRAMQRSLDGAKLMEDFFAAFEFLRDHDGSTGKVGAVGFCYGGGVCNALAALEAHQKEYSVHFYPDVNHGFHNDTTPRYDEKAAKLSWKRTLAFFDTHLRG